MEVKSYDIFALVGYMIIANQEMHSRQIKWLERQITVYRINACKEIVYAILNDRETKVSLNTAFSLLLNENKSVQKFIIILCYQMAILDNDAPSDDMIDTSEQKLLNDLSSLLGLDAASFSRIVKKAKEEINNNLTCIYPNGDNSTLNWNIEPMKKVATEDFFQYSLVLSSLFKACNQFQNDFERVEAIENPQLRKAFQALRNSFQSKVLQMITELRDSQQQKELSSRCFSLALMGRTKAGKSTLHYIMCRDGEDFIGKGEQRTTRFNRVFSWNGIKIIDTPGIGAGEIDGTQDASIAFRVLRQADIVCFIVVDDSLLDDTFSVMDEIAKYHKPMVILLNHKDDIKYKKTRLKKFLADPNMWLNRSDDQKLDGWINRIKRHASSNGYEEIVRVIPVFLLAAQIGIEDSNETFISASNYAAFVQTIDELVTGKGIFFKSQNMLDEPSVHIHESLIHLKDESSYLRLFKEKVDRIKDRTISSLSKMQKDVIRKAISYIESEFENLSVVSCSSFVEENYTERKTTVISSRFQDLLETNGIEDRIDAEINHYVDEYRTKIEEMIKDLEQEFKFAQINLNDALALSECDSLDTVGNRIPIKGILKATSIVLDIVAIWVPVLSLIAIPVSIISNFFKSQKQKEKKAKATTLKNFKKLIGWKKDSDIKKVRDSLKKELEKDYVIIETFLNDLSSQVSSILSYLNQLQSEFELITRNIDTLYAIRILQFTNEDLDSPIFTMDNVIPYRDIKGGVFEIRTKNGRKFNLEKLHTITSETISIKKYY